MSISRLRQELLSDPASIRYSGMTDTEVLASLTNDALRPLANRDFLSSAEIYNVIDRAEYIALSNAEKSELGIILGLGIEIDIGQNSKARSALAAMFRAGSTTRAELLALIQGRTQSRAKEIGLRDKLLDVSTIAAARVPDQPART